MQGAGYLSSLVIIPPGATATQARIEFDGVRGAIFLYSAGGPANTLVGSWASVGGTDRYGNTYPAGFHSQENTFATATNILGSNLSFNTIFGLLMTLNPTGLFLYSSARALGDLIVSLASSAGTDAAGNPFPQGLSAFIPISGTVYQALIGTDLGGGIMALQFQTPSSLPSTPSEVGGRAQASGSFSQLFSGQSVAGSKSASIIAQDSTQSGLPNSGVVIITGGPLELLGITPAPPTPASNNILYLWYDGTSLHAKGSSGIDVVIATT